MRMRGRFAVDKENGKLLGVCAGIARHTGIDATIVRIGFGLFAILGSVAVAVATYLVLGFVGQGRRNGRQSYLATATRDDTQERMRSHELRMQAIETYVAGSNSRLAREIEELR